MTNRIPFLALLTACSGAQAPMMPLEDRDLEPAADAAPPPAPAPAQSAPAGGMARMKKAIGHEAEEGSLADDEFAMKEDLKGGEKDEAPADGEAGPTRSWFPESFLFEPLVETDAQGEAQVKVTVPDRLTTWRVLGLAHSRDGGLAGAVSSFLGTLPVYVDPVVPPFLMAGDVVALPIQVVNTTESAITAPLVTETAGAATAYAATSVAVPARSSKVSRVLVDAPRAGQVRLSASIGRTDAVERTFDVKPSGRLLEQTRGGTLAAPREVQLVGADDLDPESARVRLLVYPGALAVLRSELANALARPGAAETGYALLLSGRAPGLLEKLGAPVEGDAKGGLPEEGSPAARLRELALVAAQRAVRHARSPDTDTAALLAEGALSHPDNPVLVRLGERLVDLMVARQRPDGTFGGDSGTWTLQRLLVATADGVRAVDAAAALTTGEPHEQGARKRKAQAVRLRASAAFERLTRQVEDPYTAAAILASRAVTDSELEAALRQRVRDAVQSERDGARYLAVGEGVVRADGIPPSRAEATALAVLALKDDPEASELLADLGATLLAAYQPAAGWGDGRANLACLQAVLVVFDEPLPERVQVLLDLDGRTVAEGDLDKDALTEIAVIDAPAAEARGSHAWTVRAVPAVPGLGFSLTLQTWVPWQLSAADRGLELSVDAPAVARVGEAATVAVQAAAPAGMPLSLRQRLPAGVQVDEQSLQALVDDGRLSSFNAADGLVELQAPALDPGDTLVLSYQVVPTLSGRLNSGATSLWPTGREELAFHVPPTAWLVQ